MKPGDRVDLLKTLAKGLAEREWDEIDLILRQFGFSWSNEWEGDGGRIGYCRNHLESGSDEALSGLNEYLFGKHQGVSSLAGSHLWKPGYFRLFLCHVSMQKKLISDVKGELEKHGVDGFVAHEDIDPTKEWITEIEAALTTCDALAAFLTDGFHESNWTDQEVGYSVSRHVLIIPVRIDMDPYGFIARYQALTPPNSKPASIATGIAKILSSNDLTAPKMAPAIVRCFEESDTFADAKARMKEVERIRSWTPEMLRALENAVARNSQVSGSWGVPDRVRAVINKYRQ